MKNSCKRASISLLLGGLFVLTGTSVAAAEPGDGIEGDNFVLKFGVGAGAGVDTNLFSQNDNQTIAPLLSVAPGMSVRTLNTDVLDLSLDAGLNYRQFLSSNAAVQAQSGLSADVGAGVHFNRAGAFSLKIHDKLIRAVEAPYVLADQSVKRINNKLGVTAGIHPGGRALQGFLSYSLQTFLFDFDASSYDQANKNEHDIGGKFAWQFLPKNAFYLDASYRLINYSSATRVVAGSTLANVNSRPLRVKAGLNGLLFERVGTLLELGYGRSNYTGLTTSFNGVLARVNLKYFLNEAGDSSFGVGYERDFSDATLGNFVKFNRFSASYNQLALNKRLSFSLDAGADLRSYDMSGVGALQLGSDGNGNVISADIPEVLSDIRFNGSAALGYNVRRWFNIGATYNLMSNISNTNIATSSAVELPSRSFFRHMVGVNATLEY